MTKRLIPIYTAEAFLDAWPIISKGVERVYQFTDGDNDISLFFNDVLSKRIQLWICFEDGKYQGFVCTSFKEHATTPPARHFIINYCFKKPSASPDWIPYIFDWAESLAKDNGCSEVRFYSKREWGKMVKEFGYQPSYTEFRKEVA